MIQLYIICVYINMIYHYVNIYYVSLCSLQIGCVSVLISLAYLSLSLYIYIYIYIFQGQTKGLRLNNKPMNGFSPVVTDYHG